ncbi:uncharacterized protein LOC134263652 [Saccostrea cucullata]|uniref:uncharacterized protein LOC134263652 n=1 Tax=Saccostrea cuccullata TaxID=36930 RepID=UPI002ED1D607
MNGVGIDNRQVSLNDGMRSLTTQVYPVGGKLLKECRLNDRHLTLLNVLPLRYNSDKGEGTARTKNGSTESPTTKAEPNKMKKYRKILGGGFLVGVGAAIGAPALLHAMGFKSTGVAAGSLGAWLMSVGATGLSGGALLTIGSIAGGSYVVMKLRKSKKKNI